ncbi:CRAL-TRIO domain-containing protein [Hysterangium stoloniferum]|nr:CRAL-TRIO domain-containing protein [Hysterangium stoloniferum]
MESSSILDSTEQKALEQLRKEVEDEKIIQPGDTIGCDDWTLIRFLRARSFNVKEAKTMLIKCQEWRKSVEGIGIDALYDEMDIFDYPERETIAKFWPTDKVSNSVSSMFFMINWIITARSPPLRAYVGKGRLYQEVDPKIHWRSLLVMLESFVRELMPACAKTSGKPVDGTCIIVDFNGFGLRQFWKMKYLMKDALQIAQDYYPETMGRVIFINTPATFSMIWAVIKPWLSQITASKVEILGSNINTLLEYVDAENLPSSFGGKCKCEDLGGCDLSSVGPWLEGRVYKGRGQSKYMAKSLELEKEGDI